MGKRSDFKRRYRDEYDTPESAVLPLLPHLPKHFGYAEPCMGAGKLMAAINAHKRLCFGKGWDLYPRFEGVKPKDALTLTESDMRGSDLIITNPPWSRPILHGMIEHFRNLRPTWLLFDADWMHTKQATPFLPYCHKIVSVGRVSWMENGTSGKDNCAWYLFDKEPAQTEFIGRAA